MWQDFIVCSGPDCDFYALVRLVKVLINNLVVFSTFLATGAFAWAGFLLIKAGGAGAKEDAKKIFQKVGWGYLWILAAWIVVYTITTALLDPGYTFLRP